MRTRHCAVPSRSSNLNSLPSRGAFSAPSPSFVAGPAAMGSSPPRRSNNFARLLALIFSVWKATVAARCAASSAEISTGNSRLGTRSMVGRRCSGMFSSKVATSVAWAGAGTAFAFGTGVCGFASNGSFQTNSMAMHTTSKPCRFSFFTHVASSVVLCTKWSRARAAAAVAAAAVSRGCWHAALANSNGALPRYSPALPSNNNPCSASDKLTSSSRASSMEKRPPEPLSTAAIVVLLTAVGSKAPALRPPKVPADESGLPNCREGAREVKR
mmetsp:Transcript_48936/g.96916  ORF Transcript_48936/g.96916 Transcript_48936/m.96916 type:complete len:271 (-) Transcript_48936:77-889(-)